MRDAASLHAHRIGVGRLARRSGKYDDGGVFAAEAFVRDVEDLFRFDDFVHATGLFAESGDFWDGEDIAADFNAPIFWGLIQRDLIARTAAEGVSRELLDSDIALLTRIWTRVSERAQTLSAWRSRPTR